jgi:hypothetical protein
MLQPRGKRTGEWSPNKTEKRAWQDGQSRKRAASHGRPGSVAATVGSFNIAAAVYPAGSGGDCSGADCQKNFNSDYFIRKKKIDHGYC